MFDAALAWLGADAARGALLEALLPMLRFQHMSVQVRQPPIHVSTCIHLQSTHCLTQPWLSRVQQPGQYHLYVLTRDSITSRARLLLCYTRYTWRGTQAYVYCTYCMYRRT